MVRGRPSARRRKVWAHRLVVACTVLTGLAVLATAIPLAYVRWRDGQVVRVPGLRQTLDKTAAPELPLNILLVGSDTRADITGAETKSFGDAKQVKGQRSDTMMVVHLDPGTRIVSVLSIPRDLYVTVVGLERQDRINKAFDTEYGGGPRRLVQTIQRELGIQINHYAEVDFVGFRGVVKAVGGVPVWVPYPARDRVTGLDLPSAGCLMLTPDQALAYVRSRHYQEYRNGRWRTDPTSDLGRIERQQGFMRHTLRRAIAKGARNPIVLNRLVDSAVKSVTLDDGFSSRAIARLARTFRGVAPEAVHTFVLPTEPAVVDKAAVLLLDKAAAQDVINRFNGFLPPPPLTPADVIVVVRQGSGARSAALAKAQERFSALGFAAPAARRTSAATSTRRVATTSASTSVSTSASTSTVTRPVRTVVRHRPDTLDKAQLVASYVIGGATLLEDPTLRGADVVVDLGSGWQGLRDAPLAAPGPVLTDNDEAAAHACA